MLVLKVREGNTWKDLDLYGNESINFNKSVLEVQEFEKRASDFTKTFRIPGTAFNNQVMGNIFKINLEDSSFDPKQSLECAITNAGNVIIVGSLRLEKMYVNVGKVDYEVVVYSQVGSLSSQTSEKTLCDLNFNEYTHDLTFDNIRDSWTLALFNGDIVYPFIHYGYDDEDVIPDIEFTLSGYSFDNPGSALPYWYYKPAIRVNKVIEKIIESAGYEVQSDFMNTDDFNNLYMPLSFSSEFGVQTLDDISFYASLSTDDAIPVGDHNVVFDIEISDTSNQYNSFTGFYTFDREGSFSFKVDYTLSTTDCCEYEGDPYYHLYDRWTRLRGGTLSYYNERFLGYQCDVDNVSFTKDITIQVGPGQTWQVGDQIAFGTSKRVIDCNQYTITSSDNNHSDITYYGCEDDTTPITLRVYAGSPETICANPDIPPVFTQHSGTIVDNGPCPAIHTCDATINFLSTFLLYDTPSEPGIGSSVLISQNMNCDTSQLDFLKGIFQHYNMVVVPDPDDPVKLIIEPWNNWVNAPDVVVRDWTNFLDTGKDVVVQPLVDNDNRYVKLYDVEDDDRYNKLYQDNQNQIFGEVLFDADTQILSKVKEVETIFSPTPSDGVDGNPRFIIPHLYEQDDAGNKSPFATNPRILYYNGLILNTQGSYWVRDENDISYQLYTFPCMSISQYLYGSDVIDRDKRVLSWNNVNNYYSQLTGFNTSNMTGSYYELYWKEYFVDIYDSDSRLITAYFNLPFQEFIQTKLNDKIQISGLFGNTQWRINRIIDYDLMDPGKTKVELTKILQEPEPIKETRTYLLEKCDEQVELVAKYSSFLPLEVGISVQTDKSGFEDVCYEITKVYGNETYDRYYTEYHDRGSGNLPRPYEKTLNIEGVYSWNWTFRGDLLDNTFELRYGINGLPNDGDLIYTSGPMIGSGVYTFDNSNGLNITSSIIYRLTQTPDNRWDYNLIVDRGVLPYTPPNTTTNITELWNNCYDCEFGDSGNIYILEDAGRNVGLTGGPLDIDYLDRIQIWDVGDNATLINFDIQLLDTYTDRYLNIYDGVNITSTLIPTSGPNAGLVSYTMQTTNNFVETTISGLNFTSEIFRSIQNLSIGGITNPRRLYGQSLDNNLTLDTYVYLGPDYPEHHNRVWKVIGKDSTRTPDVQITNPYNTGVLDSISCSGPVSYLTTDMDELYNFFIKVYRDFGSSGQVGWRYSGIGQISGNSYTFDSIYFSPNTSAPRCVDSLYPSVSGTYMSIMNNYVMISEDINGNAVNEPIFVNYTDNNQRFTKEHVYRIV